MAGCEAQVYEGVTGEMLQCLSESIENAFGLALQGDSGSASAMGTTLAWSYEAAALRLTLTCTAKPMMLSCNAIYEHLGKMLERCQG